MVVMVSRVTQPPQPQARLVHLRLRCAGGDAKNHRHLLVLEPLDVVQQERRAAAPGELADGALEVHSAHRAEHRAAARRRLRDPVGVERLGDPCLPRLPAAPVVEALVDAEAIEPRAQAGLAPVAAHLAVGVEEDLLQQVFGLLGRAGHPHGQIVEAPGVPAIHRLERLDIPFLAPARQLKVRAHVS
jgi:hypothetical protein